MIVEPRLIGLIFIVLLTSGLCEVSPKFSKIWGPGLEPDKIIMPARYFFIEARNSHNYRINSSLSNAIRIKIEGQTKENGVCRIWSNILDRKDGSYIVRYKVFDVCITLQISVTWSKEHIAKSPYKISKEVIPDQCDCPKIALARLIEQWDCGGVPTQVVNDLDRFVNINWRTLRKELITKYNKPFSVSLCHYVIENNRIYRNCYGKYVGFKMFMDSILLSLTRKSIVPDTEFFVNLGDWPLISENKTAEGIFPVFSWCASRDSYDIVMPTYDITESTLENMGRVMLDMLSVQGNIKAPWKERISKAFWRGRDSSRERLKLIELSRKYPDIFNCSLTNFFFFRDQEKLYGPKSDHISFYSFFDYKYQLGLDGTVAAYRFPYLLAGGSLVFKQDSKYYEHFYNNLVPYVHYVPIKNNLEDLVEKIEWSIKNDDEAEKIAKRGGEFANEHLLPKNIFCYYSHLLNEFTKKIVSPVEILDKMEEVKQQHNACSCNINIKEEL